MPTYDYRCRKCGHRFERFHSIKDERPKRCPRCRGRAERVPAGGAGLLFRGSGFYVTDYRSEAYREKAKAEKPAAAESGTGPGGAKPGAAESGTGSGGVKPGVAESGTGSGGVKPAAPGAAALPKKKPRRER